jgi:hypothetical protein
MYLPRKNSIQNLFLDIFKQQLLYAYTKNTLKDKISTQSVNISVNNNTNF